MFRKKAGGATGIMASGPELMKRFRVGGVNRFGVGDPRAQITQPGTKFQLNYPSQFSPQVPNTNFIPTGGGNLGTSILQSLMKPMMGPAAFYLDQEASEAESKARAANAAARAKNQRGGNVLRNRIAAQQGIDIMETTPDAFKIPGTSLTFGDAAFKFKQQNKPILDFLKGIPGLATKTRDELNEIAKGMGFPGGELDTKKVATLNRKSLLNQVNKTIDYFKDMSDEQLLDQKLKEELEIVDADTDFKDFDSRKESEKAKDTRGTVDRENVNPFELNKKVAAIGKVSHDEKILSEDKDSTDIVINNIKNKNTKKAETASEDGLNSTSKNHTLSNNILDANDKDISGVNIGSALGFKNFENLSLDERKTLYSNILESTIGDKGSIKTDKDFNLIMTGLLIAAGDSPDALTNITRGLAQGFKMYGDSLDDDRKEKREIQLTATKLAIQAEEAQKERDFKAGEKQLDRITTVINKLIAESGGSGNKFAKTLINTVAGDIETYLPSAERARFKTLSPEQKAGIIVTQANAIKEKSGLDTSKINYDIPSIINAVKTGNLKNIKIIDNTEKKTENNNIDTTDIKIKKIN
jgi:hypothetical protein